MQFDRYNYRYSAMPIPGIKFDVPAARDLPPDRQQALESEIKEKFDTISLGKFAWGLGALLTLPTILVMVVIYDSPLWLCMAIALPVLLLGTALGFFIEVRRLRRSVHRTVQDFIQKAG